MILFHIIYNMTKCDLSNYFLFPNGTKQLNIYFFHQPSNYVLKIMGCY